jgi:hypothetical protein
MAWIAFATNDSGVAIPLVAMLVVAPAVLAIQSRSGPSSTAGSRRDPFGPLS